MVLYPNLARSSCGWLSVWRDHKSEGKKALLVTDQLLVVQLFDMIIKSLDCSILLFTGVIIL
jgi:hypothetical protein